MLKSKDELRKECFSLDVSGYSDFTDNKGEIIADVIAGAPTLGNLVPMTGAKANTTVQLNILSTSLNWSSSNCNTNLSGTTTIAPRNVSVVRLNDREGLCLDEIDAKLPMIQAAGARNEELPFAELYMNQKVALNSKELEKLAWRGSVTGQTGNLNKTDGWVEIAKGELGSLAYSGTHTGFTSANAIDIVKNLLAQRTPEMYESEDMVIYMSNSYYNTLSQAIVDSYGIAGTGLFVDSGNENQNGFMTMLFPGTTVKIKSTYGLNTDDNIFMTDTPNLRYVTDLEGDAEQVDLFFDKVSKTLISDLVFAIGFQYESPARVILSRKV